VSDIVKFLIRFTIKQTNHMARERERTECKPKPAPYPMSRAGAITQLVCMIVVPVLVVTLLFIVL
jgi:hypothetical protein